MVHTLSTENCDSITGITQDCAIRIPVQDFFREPGYNLSKIMPEQDLSFWSILLTPSESLWHVCNCASLDQITSDEGGLVERDEDSGKETVSAVRCRCTR
jgi:hypothetical protein